MDPDRAIEIVKSLSDGVDPFTGERYASDSPYQNADTVRALYLALDGLDRVKRSKTRQHDGPPKAGKPWTTEEEQRVLDQFDAHVDVSKIAQELERTEGAIWARLEKLGRIGKDERMNMSGSTFPATPGPTTPARHASHSDAGGSTDPKPIPEDCPF